MPRQKDLKRVVRTRMQKTGESYTAARARVVARKQEPDYTALAGTSDETVHKATGRTWAQWVEILDAVNVSAMKHRDIARHVHEMGLSGWWSQSVTVGYERIRGLRAIGQRRSGSWEASKGRTFPVAVETLFDAFSKPRTRARWLSGTRPAVRKETRPRSIRLTWPDNTLVELWFTSKGESKSSVSVQHTRLPSKAAADEMKAWWSERLDALGEILQ